MKPGLVCLALITLASLNAQQIEIKSCSNNKYCPVSQQYDTIKFVRSAALTSWKTNQGLVHYWPFNNDFNDQIGGAHGVSKVNAEFALDRYFRMSSALYLNDGYVNLPNDVYVNGSYTVMAWVMPIKWSMSNVRLLEVGMSSSQNFLSFQLAVLNKFQLNNAIIVSDVDQLGISTWHTLKLNKWQHICFVLDDNLSAFLYIDGVRVSINRSSSQLPNGTIRDLNFIGKSRYDEVGNYVLDDLKIFNRALNLQEIQDEMQMFF